MWADKGEKGVYPGETRLPELMFMPFYREKSVIASIGKGAPFVQMVSPLP